MAEGGGGVKRVCGQVTLLDTIAIFGQSHFTQKHDKMVVIGPILHWLQISPPFFFFFRKIMFWLKLASANLFYFFQKKSVILINIFQICVYERL